MKLIGHIFFLVLLCLYCCKERNTENVECNYKGENSKENFIITDGHKNYRANDSSDFIAKFNAYKGRVHIHLDLSKTLPFQTQIEEFETIITKATDEFNLDSLESISLDFNKSNDLIFDISSIPEIQEHMVACYKRKNLFLNSIVLSKYVLKSKYIQLLLSCLEGYDLSIKRVYIEKCHLSDLKNLKNLSIKPQSDTLKIMFCNSLYIRLKKNP